MQTELHPIANRHAYEISVNIHPMNSRRPHLSGDRYSTRFLYSTTPLHNSWGTYTTWLWQCACVRMTKWVIRSGSFEMSDPLTHYTWPTPILDCAFGAIRPATSQRVLKDALIRLPDGSHDDALRVVDRRFDVTSLGYVWKCKWIFCTLRWITHALVCNWKFNMSHAYFCSRGIVARFFLFDSTLIGRKMYEFLSLAVEIHSRFAMIKIYCWNNQRKRSLFYRCIFFLIRSCCLFIPPVYYL